MLVSKLINTISDKTCNLQATS